MRVPVVTTHSLAVHATFAREVTVEAAHKVLGAQPTIVLRRRPGRAGVARRRRTRWAATRPRSAGIRQALDFPNTLELFVCGDNLRKGAALNTYEIAEEVAKA